MEISNLDYLLTFCLAVGKCIYSHLVPEETLMMMAQDAYL